MTTGIQVPTILEICEIHCLHPAVMDMIEIAAMNVIEIMTHRDVRLIVIPGPTKVQMNVSGEIHHQGLDQLIVEKIICLDDETL